MRNQTDIKDVIVEINTIHVLTCQRNRRINKRASKKEGEQGKKMKLENKGLSPFRAAEKFKMRKIKLSSAQLMLDNGKNLVSGRMKQYLNDNNIKQLSSAPYHSQSNGVAENLVKKLKNLFYRSLEEGISKKKAIRIFLKSYRNSLSSKTGKSSRELRISHSGRKPESKKGTCEKCESIAQRKIESPVVLRRSSRIGKMPRLDYKLLSGGEK
ncbi:Integrase, catalytic core domain and Ribonuclease H-like domain-containing protein [Strongyloides ratti]|uniref:Integrase, catalytic core domain and Ribonuclease H-like domain-containing protein n=1 Tax=Strongyloides ratti TaxID=34506 RepID=A0A090KV83_STRRB|nr:Integrase, catalytic core domain and Ribonuclease H-like domain-containing protein [Strongyloides ratti]CEF61430.1 Integrase, catalytic core domain and Ribonuclease H-like domain-containing protein [Strongyloides ratti]